MQKKNDIWILRILLNYECNIRTRERKISCRYFGIGDWVLELANSSPRFHRSIVPWIVSELEGGEGSGWGFLETVPSSKKRDGRLLYFLRLFLRRVHIAQKVYLTDIYIYIYTCVVWISIPEQGCRGWQLRRRFAK